MASQKVIHVTGVPCCCFCVLESITATCTPSGGGTCTPCVFTLEWSPDDVKGRSQWDSGDTLPTDDPIRWRCGSGVTFWVPYLITCGGVDYISEEITVTVTCGTSEPVEYTGTRVVNVILPEDCDCDGCHIDVHVDWVPEPESPTCGSLVMRVNPEWLLWLDPDSCAECNQTGSSNLHEAWEALLPFIPTTLEISGGAPSAILFADCATPDIATYECTWFNEALFSVQVPATDYDVDIDGQLEFIAGVRFRWCAGTVIIKDWYLSSYGDVLLHPTGGSSPACGDFIGDVARTAWGNAVNVNLGAAATLAEAAFKARNWMVGRSMLVNCNQAGSLCGCHPSADIQCAIVA